MTKVRQLKHSPQVDSHRKLNISYIIKCRPHLKWSSITSSSSSFHDLPPLGWNLTPFFLLFLCHLLPSSVLLCPFLSNNMASIFLLPLFLVLRLLQTDVLSHHLQRNLIYLDSQVRTSKRKYGFMSVSGLFYSCLYFMLLFFACLPEIIKSKQNVGLPQMKHGVECVKRVRAVHRSFPLKGGPVYCNVLMLHS